jgi:Na+-driven multidrug efflux pump
MYILARIGGLDSAWFAFPIAESIAFIVNIIWVVLLLRKNMKEMKNENMQKEYVKQE